ncbi:hypothetical protein V1511DRAFT_495923 [Dipodascopsis uninucleata]
MRRLLFVVHGSINSVLPGRQSQLLSSVRRYSTGTSSTPKKIRHTDITQRYSEFPISLVSKPSLQFNGSLKQYLIPLNDELEVPYRVFNQHPFYIPDDTGKISALLGPSDDPHEDRYKTREIGSPNNIVVYYMDNNKDYETYLKNDELKLLINSSELYLNRMQPVESQVLDSLLNQLLESNSVDESNVAWKLAMKSKSKLEVAFLILSLTTQLIKNPTSNLRFQLDKLVAIYKLFWKKSNHPNKTGLELLLCAFNEIGVQRGISPEIASDFLYLVDSLSQAYMNTYSLNGLPEACLNSYFSVLVTLDEVSRSLDLLLRLRVRGLALDPAVVVEMLSKISDIHKEPAIMTTNGEKIDINSLFAKYFGLFRPYLISDRTPAAGYKLMLNWSETLDEVTSVLNLSLKSKDKASILNTYKDLFMINIVECAINDTSLGTVQERKSIAASYLLSFIETLQEAVGDVTDGTLLYASKLCADCGSFNSAFRLLKRIKINMDSGDFTDFQVGLMETVKGLHENQELADELIVPPRMNDEMLSAELSMHIRSMKVKFLLRLLEIIKNNEDLSHAIKSTITRLQDA